CSSFPEELAVDHVQDLFVSGDVELAREELVRGREPAEVAAGERPRVRAARPLNVMDALVRDALAERRAHQNRLQEHLVRRLDVLEEAPGVGPFLAEREHRADGLVGEDAPGRPAPRLEPRRKRTAQEREPERPGPEVHTLEVAVADPVEAAVLVGPPLARKVEVLDEAL